MDSLHPAAQYAIMSVLATIYESGLVEKVDMADILRLFGVDANYPPDKSPIVSFRDNGWVAAYIDFRRFCHEEFENSEPPDEDLEDIAQEEIVPGDTSPDRKLH